jgi:GMP synthase (glutamine-hydrolysing)
MCKRSKYLLRNNTFNKPFTIDKSLKGIILSGSPFSVNDTNNPTVNIEDL